MKRLGIGAGIIALAIVGGGLTVRAWADRDAKSIAEANGTPAVSIVRPERDAKAGNLVLPGNVQAFNSAAIYARTNGYVHNWLADIGDSVTSGQTLAVIDAPDVEQQLAQARADYQTALANRRLAQSTATRWSALLKQDAVSTQESDEKNGDLAAKNALANASLANVKRLEALQGFTRITAPFSGVVTSRSTQIGALIVSGNAASTPLFTVSDVHRMRIYVRVPQVYSAQIHQGMHATLSLPEYPGRIFDAVLTRTADAVDVQSGTVLVELQADNGDRALKPGAYAQVAFPLTGSTGSVHLPSSALIFGEKGMSVAVVGPGDKVSIRPVTLGRDEGATVEILTGLAGGERVIDTPPDAIANGDTVRIAPDAPAKPQKG
ncbi:efflux RND transporter periplasmic adaptor subunit [Flavisphingomonas formosensis]|uniref:efflux RND transporter periplasmic adaptor subunit n=1 Tax=Flavisphingomonas formosensis TaxID=861534 RepID=UPI002FCCF69B